MKSLKIETERRYSVKLAMLAFGIAFLIILFSGGKALLGDQMENTKDLEITDKTGDAGYLPIAQNGFTYLFPLSTPVRDAEVYSIEDEEPDAFSLAHILVPRRSTLFCSSSNGAVYRTDTDAFFEALIVEAPAATGKICGIIDTETKNCANGDVFLVHYNGAALASVCLRKEGLASHEIFSASQIEQVTNRDELIDFKYLPWRNEFLLVFVSEQKIKLAHYSLGMSEVAAFDLPDGPWSRISLGFGVGAAVPRVHKTIDPYVISSGEGNLYIQDGSNGLPRHINIDQHSLTVSPNGCQVSFLTTKERFEAVSGIGIQKRIQLSTLGLCG